MLKIFHDYFYRLYHNPTLIQKKVYQPLLRGKDVVGLSPTGSGKTVAFLVPILSKLRPQETTQILIFEPSQELAIQTAHVARSWAKLVHARVLSLTGGANLRRQRDKLKRHPDVVVGTPGRIQVMVAARKLKLGHLKTVIIDEADNLLQGSTLSVIRQVLNAGPSLVQIGYFSATDTPILHHLRRWFAKDAKRVDVRAEDHTRGPVCHGLLRISRRKRNKMLKMLLSIPRFQALVFFGSLRGLNRAYSFFRHSHVRGVAKLAGYQGQIPRAKAMRGFRRGRIKLLLTTDIAARGLDIPALPTVINYDLPHRATEYVHRTGRTGRMGYRGLVLNFGDNHDFRDLRHLMSGYHYRFKRVVFYDRQIMSRLALRHLLNRTHRGYKKAKTRPRSSRQRKSVRFRWKRKHSKNKGMRHKWLERDRRRER